MEDRDLLKEMPGCALDHSCFNVVRLLARGSNMSPGVMGPGQKILTRVRSAIYGLGLGLENFP